MNTNKRLYREDGRLPSGGHDHDLREDVRYVLSGQPTGWAAMATKVREFDEERIKDTKEDMDTLLVFAGLFSAVLTAFLVESYQRLLPDTASQMLVTSSQTLAVMRQMSLQMSNPAYSPDIFANTTTTEVFQPSSDDIRVNVLWFASLIFSLMTASFGILVKQWLREYLAVDNPSPHARLRVHHYRYPGLAQWKVFEIAALLPLLQQLALALFFIGLCYFTASVHSSIGHTSLPLVAGWAFCFTTVTLLPVLLPRCPYRTTLLTSLHIRLARGLNWILARAYRGRCLQFFKQKGWLEWLWSIWQHLDYHCVQNDERCIVTRRTADLDILAEVDAVQSDDDLLGTAIFESLQQIHEPSWVATVKFVILLLEHRLQSSNLLSAPPCPLGLATGMLSKAAYTSAIDILCYYANVHLLESVQSIGESRPREPAKSTLRALYLLFSPSRYSLPKSGVTQLTRILHQEGTSLIWTLVRTCPESHLDLLIKGLGKREQDLGWTLADSLQYFETTIDALFHIDGLSQRSPGGQFTLECNVATWPLDEIATWHLLGRATISWVAQFVHRALQDESHDKDTTRTSAVIPTSPQNATEPANGASITGSRFVGALACLLQLGSKKTGFDILVLYKKAVLHCFSYRASTAAILSALQRTSSEVVVNSCQSFARFGMLQFTEHSLENFIAAIEGGITPAAELGSLQSDDPASTPSRLTLVHALKVLCFAVHFINNDDEPNPYLQINRWRVLVGCIVHLIQNSLSSVAPSTDLPPGPDASDPVSVVHLEDASGKTRFWAQLARCIPSLSSEEVLDLAQLTRACLSHIQQQELAVAFPDWDWYKNEPQPDYDDWLPMFKEEETLFDDSFVELVGMIYLLANGRVSNMSNATEDVYQISYRAKMLGLVERADRVILASGSVVA